MSLDEKIRMAQQAPVAAPRPVMSVPVRGPARNLVHYPRHRVRYQHRSRLAPLTGLLMCGFLWYLGLNAFFGTCNLLHIFTTWDLWARGLLYTFIYFGISAYEWHYIPTWDLVRENPIGFAFWCILFGIDVAGIAMGLYWDFTHQELLRLNVGEINTSIYVGICAIAVALGAEPTTRHFWRDLTE